MEDLKPCPFCGCEQISERITEDSWRFPSVLLECDNCGIKTYPHNDSNEVAIFWNNREDK